MASKYKAEKITQDGLTFDSQKEYRRYLVLKDMQEHGEISDLHTQREYILIGTQDKPSGGKERPVKYVADFVYVKDGKAVVEDVKGYRRGTAYSVFVIKRKLMLMKYGIEVKEV